jgi:succinate-semialdehyde dehydrogenase/glutarate-semialdehyde dehydrogenase
MYAELGLYIDGKWVNGQGRKAEDVINPATEKPLAQLPHASRADLDQALEAAKKGFAVWRAASAYDRAKIMRKAAELLRERYDAIAKIMVQEQGKVYVEARAEVLTSCEIIEWYAEEGRRSYGRIVPGRCAASPTRGCPPACSISCSACRRRCPNICSPRTPCARFPSPARFRWENISPRSPPKA